jgi:DNA topoisomerase-6 subunit B
VVGVSCKEGDDFLWAADPDGLDVPALLARRRGPLLPADCERGPSPEPLHERVWNEMPAQAKEIKPHPYGVELGVLISMMRNSPNRTVKGFLQTDFSRVSADKASAILKRAGISEGFHPKTIARDAADRLYEAIQNTKIMAPPTDCLSPIGEEQLEKGLRKEFEADFYTSTTRPPSVYRGNPFQIEAAVAYGGKLPADSPAQVIRFANRVPLL